MARAGAKSATADRAELERLADERDQLAPEAKRKRNREGQDASVKFGGGAAVILKHRGNLSGQSHQFRS
jgi:hypothetical protein